MQLKKSTNITILSLCLLFFGFSNAYSQHIHPDDLRYADPVPGAEALGRWDITITTSHGPKAGWLEISQSGTKALVGRFVGTGGSARPISEVKYDAQRETYSFTIPPQYRSHDLHAEFKLKDDKLTGWIVRDYNKREEFTAVRAPELKPEKNIQWGEPIDLLENGLSDWIIPSGGQWTFEDGVMTHEGTGGNIKTKQKFQNFKLHVEFRVSKHSNSGIYLRGRYELQVLDSYDLHTESHQVGGLYGFISPSKNMARKPGEWQTYDITLNGRMLTVELNGEKIICNRSIPGITGGALDSKEGEPGPILLQGSEYGRIEYRNFIITPEK